MKEKTFEGFITGACMGAFIALVINIFLLWGGHPEGAFTKLDKLKQEVEKLQTISQHSHNGIGGRVIGEVR